MTDDELLQLVQQKTPEELSPAEIQSLRAGMVKSEKLRDELVQHLQFEDYLSQALGRINVSVDEIINLAATGSRARRRRAYYSFFVLFPLFVGVFAVTAFVATFSTVSILTWQRSGLTGDAVATNLDGASRPSDAGIDEQTGADGGSNDDQNNSSNAVMPDGATSNDHTDGTKEDAPEVDESQVAALPLTIEAERFARGNVAVDAVQWGTKEVTIIHSEATPSFAEYDFHLREAATLEVRFRYASFNSRPLVLTINGQAIDGYVAGEQTGGHFADHQKWFSLGGYAFAKGKNTIRLESTAHFPHLDQIVIRVPQSPDPSTVVASPVAEPTTPATTDKPPITPAPAPPKILTPWQTVLEDDTPAPKFAEIGFQQFDTHKSLPSQKDIEQWFEAVPGQPSRFFEHAASLGRCGAFEGLVRLASPWRDDTALRISMEQYNRLQLHFFNGNAGVTLVYYESENFRWGAYATTRQPNAPRPDSFFLTGADEHRNLRTEIRFGGSYEIRHRAGEIVLSRGDVVLLRAPLAEAPTDVFLEGRAAFHGISLVRSSGFPDRDEPFPIAYEFDKPSELAWTNKLGEGANFENLPDGAVRLTAKNVKLRGWVAAELPPTGVYEVVLEIDAAAAGAGVFFGSREDGPAQVLRFTRNTADQRLCVSFLHDTLEANFGPLNERLIPCCSKRVWIKLLAGQATMRYWLSSDGVHWAMPQDVVANLPGRAAMVGLHHLENAPDCEITLRKITLRKLPVMDSLVDRPTIQRVPSFRDVPNFAAWKVRVIQQRPADVDLDQWTRACVVKTIAEGSNQEFGDRLLHLILDDAVVAALPIDKRLELLRETSLLSDARPAENLLAIVRRYRELAATAHRSQIDRPFSLVRIPMMTAPFGVGHAFPVADESLIRSELIELLYAGRWRELLDFCGQLKFFQQHQGLPLVDWAVFAARSRLNVRDASLGAVAGQQDWSHPFEPELSKEAYNLLAELQALIDSDAAGEAAKMIVSVSPDSFDGVAPHAKDRQLYLSFGAAMQLAVREQPSLREEIDRQYRDIAQLRVKKAIAAGDEDAVKLAAVQFESTAAAAEAHQWLGDRALTSGWFARALAEFRRASFNAGPAMRLNLAARIRLAGAMMGKEIGQPVSNRVQLGEVSFAPDEFESLVREMIGRGQYHSNSQIDGQQIVKLPPPSGFAVDKRGDLDGREGERPTDEVTRHVRRHQVDWVGRQIATAVDGETLFVSNRFHVAAYVLKTGQRLWQSQPPTGAMMRSQEWGLTPMQPLVTDRHVFARQLFNATPLLVCLDKMNGQIVWTSELPNDEHLVSDPLVVQDQLVAFSMKKDAQRDSILRLTKFAAESGEIIQQHELLRVRDSWWLRRIGAATALDDSVVASLGGLVVCCEMTGDVRWIRRQEIMPSEEEHTWVQQSVQAPHWFDGKLYIIQPGVRAVECCDPDTGRQDWIKVLPDVRRIVGVTNELMIVRTNDGFTGLNRADGQTIWRHDLADVFETELFDRDHRLVIASRITGNLEAKTFRVRLTWLDGASGTVTAWTDLPELDDAIPQFGPLLAHGGNLWAFFGRGHDVPRRDVMQLTPKGEARKPADKILAANVWTRQLDPSLRESAGAMFSDWTLLNGQPPLPMPAQPVTPSETPATGAPLAVDCLASSPVMFGRRVTVPDSDQPRLRILLGHERAYTTVSANGKVLWDAKVDAKFADQSWKYVDVDLSAYRNTDTWITVSARTDNPDERKTTLWQRLEIVP